MTVTLNEFIRRSNERHSSRYDYSQVDWHGTRIPVEIVCPEHGPFWRSPGLHYASKSRTPDLSGCHLCRQGFPTKEWKKALQKCLYGCKRDRLQLWPRWAYAKANNLNNYKGTAPNGTRHAERVATTWWGSMELAVDRLNRRVYWQRRPEWSKRMKVIASKMALVADQRRQGERITPTQLLELLETQNYKCALTGCDLSPEDVSVDHCVPTSRGGQHCIENMQLVTKAMNKLKGTLTNAELLALCKQVVSTLGD